MWTKFAAEQSCRWLPQHSMADFPLARDQIHHPQVPRLDKQALYTPTASNAIFDMHAYCAGCMCMDLPAAAAKILWHTTYTADVMPVSR